MLQLFICGTYKTYNFKYDLLDLKTKKKKIYSLGK